MAVLTRNWWLLVVRGLAAIAFGVLTVAWPGASLAALVALFGIYCLVEGFTSLALAFMQAEGRTGTWILHAIVGIGAGVLTLTYPGMTSLVLYSIIAGWAIATGIVEIWVASELRGAASGVGTIIFAGVVSILFGALLVALPAAGVVALVSLIAALAIMSGIAWVMVGVRLHRLAA
jgi:uncharacterized membrane protein HdeD (DUF308 family)